MTNCASSHWRREESISVMFIVSNGLITAHHHNKQICDLELWCVAVQKNANYQKTTSDCMSNNLLWILIPLFWFKIWFQNEISRVSSLIFPVCHAVLGCNNHIVLCARKQSVSLPIRARNSSWILWIIYLSIAQVDSHSGGFYIILKVNSLFFCSLPTDCMKFECPNWR